MEPYHDVLYVTPRVIGQSPAHTSPNQWILHQNKSKIAVNPAEQLEEVNITLCVEMNAVEVFLVEAMQTAVIDTACTHTVFGER